MKKDMKFFIEHPKCIRSMLLDRTEISVLSLRKQKKNIVDIADMLDLSPTRIRQILMKAKTAIIKYRRKTGYEWLRPHVGDAVYNSLYNNFDNINDLKRYIKNSYTWWKDIPRIGKISGCFITSRLFDNDHFNPES